LQGSQAVRTKARETADSLTQGIKEAAQTTTRAVKARASEFTTDVGHGLNRVLEQQKARGADTFADWRAQSTRPRLRCNEKLRLLRAVRPRCCRQGGRPLGKR
jgi:hypothetical protein